MVYSGDKTSAILPGELICSIIYLSEEIEVKGKKNAMFGTNPGILFHQGGIYS